MAIYIIEVGPNSTRKSSPGTLTSLSFSSLLDSVPPPSCDIRVSCDSCSSSCPEQSQKAVSPRKYPKVGNLYTTFTTYRKTLPHKLQL